MPSSTLRSDMAAGLKVLVEAFAAANPTFGINACYRSRPASMGNRPLAFVGPRPTTISNDRSVLYIPEAHPTVVFVWASGADQMEVADVRDDLIDAFVVYASNTPHAVSSDTTCAPTSVEDVELDLDGAFYPASIVTFEVWSGGGRT